MSRRSPMLLLAGAAAGMIAWAAQFTLIYGATAIACARGYDDARLLGLRVIPLMIMAVTLAALAITVLVLARALAARRVKKRTDATGRFLNAATILIASLSLVAILWQGLPALIVPPCW